jgi:glycerophosphoryl diester phosphodiesterase
VNLPSGFVRIGHGGASALAPANTLASFDAALQAGIDMLEFDVRAGGGRLVLAHTILHARRRPLTLDAALRHLSQPRFAALHFNLDVKHTGCETVVVEELQRHGLLERSLVSSQVAEVLDRFREREPRLGRGISVGGRIARTSRRWRGWRGEVATREGRLYAWTVNDAGRLRELHELTVDGATSADPRLFSFLQQPV